MTAKNDAVPLVLFVDDEANTVKYFKQAIEAIAPVVTAGSVEEGKRILDQYAESLMVLVSDQRMPGAYGNELLHYARESYPHMIRILTTAYSELDHTVEAVNQGQIHRYIQKPWEVSALKMEIKQALELAMLRKEHAELLNEKMGVRLQQTMAHRIGMLYTICNTVSDQDDLSPLQIYLSVAEMLEAKPHQPDWQVMDYGELVAAEARRSGKFGHEVARRLAEMRQRHHGWQIADGFEPLTEELAGWGQVPGDGSIVLQAGEGVTEFLEAAPDTDVSDKHAAWFAFLIWLHEKGSSLSLQRSVGGVQVRLEAINTAASSLSASDWIGKFCEP